MPEGPLCLSSEQVDRIREYCSKWVEARTVVRRRMDAFEEDYAAFEGVLKIDPEVILDLVGDQSYYHAPDAADPDRVFSSEHLMAPWLRLSDVRAVREGRVHILRGTFLLRPGPRIPQIVEAFARCIHPGALSDDQAPAAR